MWATEPGFSQCGDHGAPMKDIYIAGSYHVGKTSIAKRLAENFGLKHIMTDDAYTPIREKYPRVPISYPEYLTDDIKRDLTNSLISLVKDQPPFVLEGFALNYRDIREVIRSTTGRDRILFYISPSYESWKRLYDRRYEARPDVTSLDQKTWKFYVDWMRRFEPPDDFYYTAESALDLVCSPTPYQREPLSARKFAGLKLQNVRGRVLDLGCAEGLMGKFLKANAQAQEVVGIDSSWWYLEQARENGNTVVLGDLNVFNLTELGKFDYTLCLSILHRIMDKEHLIRQIAKATKHEAIFELPLNRRSGLVSERYDSVPGHTKNETQAWCPSQEILELWFSKYFAKWEMVGLSPLSYGDQSWRLVYRCQTHS
jgi:2-polyprenyl-3-methyl-5-hydroxy-6-metoxy-1,4-benzoquinol methylase/gluconate kinase